MSKSWKFEVDPHSILVSPTLPLHGKTRISTVTTQQNAVRNALALQGEAFYSTR